MPRPRWLADAAIADRGDKVLNVPDEYQELRKSVRELCADFPGDYFRRIDERRAYPKEFVQALTNAG